MAKGFKHGAGEANPLNFSIKAYPSETELMADNPKENTIGVITTTTISSWCFSSKEPSEPVVGMVWISIGTSSTVEFNALKKNGIQVYPIRAKQYVGGAWKSVEAKSFQNGVWAEWVTYLFKDGNEYTDLTGGWTNEGYSYNGYGFGQFVNDGEKLICNGESGSRYAGGGTKNKINITGKTILKCSGYGSTSDNTAQKIGLFTSKVLSNTPVAYISLLTEDFDKELDISGVPAGEYYIGIFFGGSFTEVGLI
jgi:hypothetical protein